MRGFLSATIAALVAAGPALAQEAASDDWDLVRDDRQKSVMAFTVFDNGLGVSLRCVDGAFDAIIGGLPPAGDRGTRPMELTFRDDASAWKWDWNVAVQDTMAVSPLPAMMAREMREGGRFQVRVPDGGGPGRAMRYDVELPTSATAVDTVLTACGKPLVDPRDAELQALNPDGLPGGLMWRQRPRIEYPMSHVTYARGFAVVSCVAHADGRARDCVIETEHPRDGGFGEAVISGMRSARLASADGHEMAPARLVFRTNFVMDGYETREDRERSRDSRERQREEREATRRPG